VEMRIVTRLTGFWPLGANESPVMTGLGDPVVLGVGFHFSLVITLATITLAIVLGTQARDALAFSGQSRCSATPASAPAPAPNGTAGRTGAPMRAPMGSISTHPGALQTAVDTHGPNTAFLLTPGVYRDGPIVPKDGDSFYGEGRVIWDGGGKRAAFKSGSSEQVIVSGMGFTHFSPPNQGAGIFTLNNGERGFLIEGCEIAGNDGTPVVVGNGTHVLNNSIHDNYWIGIGGYEINGAVIEHNEIYNNQLAKSAPDTPTGEASGMKFTKTENVSILSNFVHDNFGVGIWFDTDNSGTLIDRNVVSDNTHRGIMEEISYGAIISNNTIRGNGKLSGWIAGAGVFVSTAANVEICNNIIKGNYQGVTGFQEDRGAGGRGIYTTTNAFIHDNYITMERGVTGFTSRAINDPSNLFRRNHYCLTGRPSFLWGNKTDARGWQAVGNDSGGTFNCGF
jgi:parallel beta-helix repeat protein